MAQWTERPLHLERGGVMGDFLIALAIVIAGITIRDGLLGGEE